jgi:hypothetical protein
MIDHNSHDPTRARALIIHPATVWHINRTAITSVSGPTGPGPLRNHRMLAIRRALAAFPA